MEEATRQFAGRSRTNWSSSTPSSPPCAVVSVSAVRTVLRAGDPGHCGRRITPKSCNGQTVVGSCPARTASGITTQPLTASTVPWIPSRRQSASGRATVSAGVLRFTGASDTSFGTGIDGTLDL
jgi:hypothetical protein